MGVDYYSCDNCGETFPDCGIYIHCENGHRIGPCCFPKVNGRYTGRWPEDQTTEDAPDYGTAVMENRCPVCAKGGNETQRLEKARATEDALRTQLSEAVGLLRRHLEDMTTGNNIGDAGTLAGDTQAFLALVGEVGT